MESNNADLREITENLIQKKSKTLAKLSHKELLQKLRPPLTNKKDKERILKLRSKFDDFIFQKSNKTLCKMIRDENFVKENILALVQISSLTNKITNTTK